MRSENWNWTDAKTHDRIKCAPQCLAMPWFWFLTLNSSIRNSILFGLMHKMHNNVQYATHCQCRADCELCFSLFIQFESVLDYKILYKHFPEHNLWRIGIQMFRSRYFLPFIMIIFLIYCCWLWRNEKEKKEYPLNAAWIRMWSLGKQNALYRF